MADRLIGDARVLYELALAAHRRPSVAATARDFLTALVSRVPLARAALWLRNDPDTRAADDAGPTEIAVPPHTAAGPSRALVISRCLAGAPVLLDVDRELRDFALADAAASSVAVFALAGQGALELVTTDRQHPLTAHDVHELDAVVAVLATSIDGALTDERLRREIAARDSIDHDRRRARSLLTAVIENARAGVLVEDADGTVALVNDEFCQMFGIPSDAVLGGSCALLASQAAPAFVGETFTQGIEMAVDGRSPGVQQLEMHDGRTLERTHVRMDIREGGLHNLWLYRDVSAKRAAEEALQRRTEEAVAANRAKSRFVSRMSHELRTPLNAVLGFAQYLTMDGGDPLTERQRERIEIIHKAGSHLLQMIEEILDISRVEAGEIALRTEVVSIREVVDEVLLLIEPLARARGITCTLAADGGSSLHVHADRQRLRQVVLNLLSNAVKFNRDGGTVRVTLTREDAMARVTVDDSGRGIPEGELARVFEPFDRLDVGDEDVPGTGLGLPLSKGLVETMGGAIGVGSEVGRGTSFWFTLPACDDAESRRPGIDVPSSPAETASVGTVLLAEDDLVNRLLMVDVLEALGWRVETASDGVEALRRAGQIKPDVVLADVQMPRLDGLALTRRLKDDVELSDIPVIALTAMVQTADVEASRAAGCAAHLAKPVDVEELRATLDRLVVR